MMEAAGRCAGWMLLALLLAVVAVVALPALTEHALRHADARDAWDWVARNGDYCKYNCPDGRTRWVCGMAGRGQRWAIVVIQAERLITAFVADQDYARTVIDGCYAEWRFLHP